MSMFFIDPYRFGPAPQNPSYLWTNGTDTWTDSWVAPATLQVMRAVTPLTGKVYCEFTIPVRQGVCPIGIGIDNGVCNVFYNAGSWTMFSGNGQCGLPASGLGTDGTESSNAAYSFAVGVRIGIAFDAITGNLWYSKDGVWVQGDPGAGTSPSQTIPVATRYWHVSRYSCNIASGTNQILIHPRVADQLYPVPSGFIAYQP